MSENNGNLPMLGDWSPTTPRTQAFLSTLLGDGVLQSENRNEVPLSHPEKSSTNSFVDGKDGDSGKEGSGASMSEFSTSGVPRAGPRGGLVDRMAARAGFNAPKLNTSEIRSANLSSSTPDVKSHQIPLSPGFSPSAFLDSPVFLFNSLAQPSPTTGKILLGMQENNSSAVIVPSDISKEFSSAEVEARPFTFKPHVGSMIMQPLERLHGSVRGVISDQAESMDVIPENKQENLPFSGFSEPSDIKAPSVDFSFNSKPFDSTKFDENSPPPVDQVEVDELKGDYSSVSNSNGQQSDGYNWRKYGQKHVKGSEFPRSYYKCTHPNCQVKKKVECAPGGQITEIVYKGTHNHSLPALTRHASVTSSQSFGSIQFNGSENQGMQGSTFNGTTEPDWMDNNMGATSSLRMETEPCDPFIPLPTQDACILESYDAIDASLTLSNEEEEDVAQRGSTTISVDGEDEESEMKRRKLEGSLLDMSSASRAVREPRVVVQTTSEVDILDDGYRWRKYGQKVVKGNPNPRSYYKCTSVGCTVRKHVERASHDLKAVITTYEGKHNHEVPVARSSSHSSSISSGTINGIAPQLHNSHRRVEPGQVPRFDSQAGLSSFGMPPAGEQLGPSPGYSFGLNQPSLTSLAMAGLVPGGPMKMLPQLRPYLGTYPLTEPAFMVPKGEPVEEQTTHSSLPASDDGGSSAVYQQIIGRLPLEPQM